VYARVVLADREADSKPAAPEVVIPEAVLRSFRRWRGLSRPVRVLVAAGVALCVLSALQRMRSWWKPRLEAAQAVEAERAASVEAEAADREDRALVDFGRRVAAHLGHRVPSRAYRWRPGRHRATVEAPETTVDVPEQRAQEKPAPV
jgi:hypothetical protein